MVKNNIIIAYDLKRAGDYNSFFHAIQQLGSALPILTAAWYVKTTKTAAECQKHLEQFINIKEDSLVIFNCSNNTGATINALNEDALEALWLRQ